MEDILRKMDDLSLDELDKLYKHIYSIREVKGYFEGIEKEQNNYLPENVGDIIKNKVKIIKINKNEGAYLAYEEGNSFKITIEVDGIDGQIELKYIKHNSKHTYTEYRSITMDSKIYQFGYGDYYKNHFIAGQSMENDIYILRKLHDKLEIPYGDSNKMIHLLFYPHSFYPYLEESEETLEYLLDNKIDY